MTVKEIMEQAKDGSISWEDIKKREGLDTEMEKLEKMVRKLEDDTISRQAAIDLIKNDAFWVQYAWGGRGHKPEMEMVDDLVESIIKQMKESVMSRLKQMPSAQPEIIQCKNCGHWDTTWQNDFAPNYHYCSLVDGTRRGDFYCADAERRR